jgi:glycosyltransferase involved in cell wall biosynthesis
LVYPTKDQRSLLQAIRLVVDQVPTFRFLVVGDGPYRAELEQLRATLQLTENVELLGQRTDVSQLLAQSDFFVLSSLYEGLSLTLLEAAATGLPIVATRVGGNPEVVEHGVNGLLVPPKDPVKLAEAMVQLIRQPLQAGDMGRAGRAKMVEQFDLRRTVAKYETLYRQLAAN